jgi:hypothetical protein
MPELLSRDAVHVGAVRGRYFRENFAQGGIDLAQIVPELVTNADAAIAAGGRPWGRIELTFGAPDAGFLAAWRAQMRALRVPALRSWRFEVRCGDDGVGVDAPTVDCRLGALGALGELPEHGAQRGLFGRGLRDVWLAQGAGRIAGAELTTQQRLTRDREGDLPGARVAEAAGAQRDVVQVDVPAVVEAPVPGAAKVPEQRRRGSRDTHG